VIADSWPSSLSDACFGACFLELKFIAHAHKFLGVLSICAIPPPHPVLPWFFLMLHMSHACRFTISSKTSFTPPPSSVPLLTPPPPRVNQRCRRGVTSPLFFPTLPPLPPSLSPPPFISSRTVSSPSFSTLPPRPPPLLWPLFHIAPALPCPLYLSGGWLSLVGPLYVRSRRVLGHFTHHNMFLLSCRSSDEVVVSLPVIWFSVILFS
jgi:hypothetical protein